MSTTIGTILLYHNGVKSVGGGGGREDDETIFLARDGGR